MVHCHFSKGFSASGSEDNPVWGRHRTEVPTLHRRKPRHGSAGEESSGQKPVLRPQPSRRLLDWHRGACHVGGLPESWEQLKPVSPVLLLFPRGWPPAMRAVRCGDRPRSER